MTTSVLAPVNLAPSYQLFFERLDGCVIPAFTGLSTKNDSSTFKMTGFRVDAVVTDATVTNVFTQSYSNSSTSPVEAQYKMPLAPGAAVTKFVVTYDDKVLVGKIKEKEKAANTYNDAISSGNQAFLVEKSSNGTFSTLIGNLPPTKDVTVSITIVSEIGTHFDNFHFGLHRYMFPKYQFDFNLKLDVSLSVPIQSIELSDYQSDVTIKEKTATVHVSTKDGVPKNLIAIIKPASSERPSYFVEKSADNTYALGLNFYPSIKISPDEVDQCSEFIFLVDCSGSMSGSTIAQAKRCLEILMRSLTEKSKFNIWQFGSTFVSQFKESRLYNDETLEAASAYIERIDANLGGTELLPPMEAIIRQPVDPKYPRQVFILTDGEVSQRDQLVDFVGKEAGTTRIFTLGIGSGVDRLLVQGLSKACRGYYEFINDNSMMQNQVMKLMGIAMEPIISNVQVEWDGLPVLQAPKSVRPIFNNERLFLYGLLENVPENLTTKNIVVTADGPTGQTLRYEIPVDFANANSQSNSIHTLAANFAIRDLEEEEKSKKDANKEAIVKLGKKYQLISNHTSFVVVAESDKPIEETMQTVQILEAPAVSSPPIPRLSSPSYNTVCAPSPVSSSSSLISKNLVQSIQTQLDTQLYMKESLCDLSEQEELSQAPLQYERKQKSSIFSGFNFLSNIMTKQSAPAPSPGSSAPPPPASAGHASKQALPKNTSSQGSASSPLYSAGPSISASPLYDSSPIAQPTASYGHVSKRESSNDLMGLISSQKANGSWTSVPFSVPAKPSELSAVSDDCWTTLCVLATLNNTYSSQRTQWQQIATKATKWVKSQLTAASLADQFDAFLALATSAI